jgi:hypothetical protein
MKRVLPSGSIEKSEANLNALRDEAAGLIPSADSNEEKIAGPTSSALSLSPKEKAGLWIISGVGTISTLTIATILIVWGTHIPQPPVPPKVLTKDTLDLYKSQSEIYQSIAAATTAQVTAIFDAIVARTLLPVVTAILSYIFVQHAKEAKNDD